MASTTQVASLARRGAFRLHSRMATRKPGKTRSSTRAATSSGGEETKTTKQSAPARSASARAGDPSDDRPDVPIAKGRPPRTASGKRGDPQQLAVAQAEAHEGLRERTEAGHRAAGRTPPSAVSPVRRPNAARRIDDDLRDFVGPETEDAKLLQAPIEDRRAPGDFTRTDTWRVMRIMGEFIEGFDNLAKVERGVSIFGSARTSPDDPQYLAAQETARLLAEAGFSIITGAGPGIMEAANKGAKEGNGRSIG